VPRVLGLDLGTRRIGVAVSSGTVATPHTVLERAADQAADHAAVATLVDELGVERVVVGLPLSLDGRMGPAATAAAAEAEALGDVLGVPVETYDERLTTVTADRSLSSQGLSGRARRRVVDKVAAAVMLQAWLDRFSP
jgi:putative Holliday junction resolvase